MIDNVSKKRRSEIMSSVKPKDTKPEMIVRRFLHRKGFRYRLHSKELPGHPDMVLRRFKTVVFVHGCFWHGHRNCKLARIPKSNVDFWKEKIAKNFQRDSEVSQQLNSMGWRALVIWECELKDISKLEQLERAIREG